ncbi:MAG: Gfo/Idh/MocA family oxidoreductase [Candidatus Kapabacteria bacterium]|nr:Gfo/Idh/MocA family oxidoreductase [Candidatus Kapabacteria bacterium]
MRISVIGSGHLGSIHARLLAQNADVSLVGIVDPDETRGSAIASEHGAQWYPDLTSMPDVDAVVIAAPTSLHHSLAVACLERGFHCFIEKPVTATYAEAQELMQRAEATDRVIQVGHVERFNPAVRALASYSIQPLFIEAHRLAPFKPRAIDVSVIHDLMIHDIDLLLWMTGSEIVDIQATGVAVLTKTPDICNARLTFANGCVANVTASRISAKPMRKLRVFQKDSYVSLDLASGAVELYQLIETSALEPSHQVPLGTVNTEHGDRVIVYDTPIVESVNAIAEEQRSFLESIRNQTSAAVTLHDGAQAVRIAEWIDKLVRT